MKKKKTPAQKAALYGVLVALAMILSYIEVLIPLPGGIPGVKPGLANLVVFFALYSMSAGEAFLISMVRIVLVSITFGNGSAFLYSMAGGILSFLVMWICQKKEFLMPTGVSIAGGIAHNVGQLLVAMLFFSSTVFMYYLPYLMLFGILSGIVIGILGEIIYLKIGNQLKKRG